MNLEKLKQKLNQKTLNVQFSLRINEEQLAWLQAFAQEMDVSVNKLIITVLDQFQEESDWNPKK